MPRPFANKNHMYSDTVACIYRVFPFTCLYVGTFHMFINASDAGFLAIASSYPTCLPWLPDGVFLNISSLSGFPLHAETTLTDSFTPSQVIAVISL